ncbi:MAG: hypothetical protein ACRDUV_22145, partial [Pseudonocardiaceae bacterium]
HCACGAVTDRAGRWVDRNSRRRTPDPAGLCRDPETPQPVRARVAAGTPPPGARRHPRSHQTDDPIQQRRHRQWTNPRSAPTENCWQTSRE